MTEELNRDRIDQLLNHWAEKYGVGDLKLEPEGYCGFEIEGIQFFILFGADDSGFMFMCNLVDALPDSQTKTTMAALSMNHTGQFMDTGILGYNPNEKAISYNFSYLWPGEIDAEFFSDKLTLYIERAILIKEQLSNNCDAWITSLSEEAPLGQQSEGPGGVIYG